MSLIEDSKHLRIPFEEIRDATQNFTTLIGRGGYGPVYRGQLSFSGEHMVVAVKRLQRDHGQGLKEFLTEIQLLSRYKHRNIVSLVGFCEELNEKFLIYEYAEHGSLDKYLNPVKKRGLLTWKQRINICIDAARGLDHLHYRVAQNQRVIHRDIKSANILLDHNRKAMIADFGLSKIGRANENDTYLITNASGTHGYCDPAYIRTGILTKESDVYSFGVVLFEVLCGRLCFMNVDNEERFLAPLAQRYYEEGKLNLIIDRDLKSYKNSDSMKVFSEIAFHCLNDDRKLRPSMSLVLKILEIALSLLDKEEAHELLELEEALEVRKIVETLQIQQFEEACEMHAREEALWPKLVETLQQHEFEKTLKSDEAWKFQDKEEAHELLELEEALEVRKIVETLQIQQFEEACEMHAREEALWPKLVETLQQHEFEKTLKSDEAWKFQDKEKAPELLELEEAPEVRPQEEWEWGFQKLVQNLQSKIGASRIDYEVLKAIYDMRDTRLSYIASDLSSGILVDNYNVWLSIDDDGKTQELISAIKFVSLARHGSTIKQEPKSRFSKVAKVTLTNHEMQVKISTQFLSSDVSYAAYLVCKPDSYPDMEDNAAYSLIYKLNYQSKSYISYPSKMEDNGWWMFELFQTTKFKRTTDVEVTFVRMNAPFGSRSYLLIEGIHFLPIKKFKEENELQKSEPNTSNVDWDNLLPSDYKQYIYYSNKDMMNTPQTDVIFPTKEEAYSILSRGVLIKLNNEINMWFWITKSNGKKCFMLPPAQLSYNERLAKINRIASKESRSRIENVLHLSPSNVVGMRFKVPTSLFSPNTTYGCYLVYKMPQHFARESMVTMKLDDGRTLLSQQHGKLITYLSIPQSPVIGPHGVKRSLRPINKLKTIQLPRKRNDGWLELNLGTRSDVHWMNMQPYEQYDNFWQRKTSWKSCFFPCLSDESSDVYMNAKSKNSNYALNPQRISNITIYIWPLCIPTETPELIVQGIEFRPV